MSRFLFSIVVALATLSATNSVAQTSQFGRYSGVLKHDSIGQEQLAKLDFVVSRREGNELRLIAVLSLYFGSFNSDEYVTYHFDNVRYNIVTGALVFDQPDQEATVTVDDFGQGRLEGDFRATTAGNVGRLVLASGATAEASLPLIQPLWGEYRGMCDGISTRLQIQTGRSSENASGVGNSFGSYDVSAQLAEDGLGSCGDGVSSCTKRVYQSGSYDFFSGTLSLYGNSMDQQCTMTTTGLSCNGCDLRRSSNEAAPLGQHALPTATPTWTATPAPGRDDSVTDEPASGIQGEYRGYVHHERTGVYQPAKFNIVTFQQPTPTGSQLKMSAVGTLLFGDFTSQESIAYRFNERTYDLLAPQVVFERMDGDTDAVVQVTQIANGVIKGVWYSVLYGRVGTFEMRKVGPPPLPAGARVMEPIAGNYSDGLWRLGLKVARESVPVNTRNPFFPLNFKGHFRLSDITANKPISGGTYDFYTGKISMKLDDGTGFVGSRNSRALISLKRPVPGILRPLQPHAPLQFTLVQP